MSGGGPDSGSRSASAAPDDGEQDTPRRYLKRRMRGWAYVDKENDNEDVTYLYTQEGKGGESSQGRGYDYVQEGDERQKRTPAKNRMKGWAYVDDDGGKDVTYLHSGEPIARRRREEQRFMRDEDGDEGEGDEDIEMGGMGSNNDEPTTTASKSPLPTPPNLDGLPPPNQPNNLIPIPRNQEGKSERRLLNADPSMWWNQPGQWQTNPPSHYCYDCMVKHKPCDLFSIGYPCTRREQKGINCRNGLPSQKWEQRQIMAQTSVGVLAAPQRSGGRASDVQGRERTGIGAVASGRGGTGSGGRGSGISGKFGPGESTGWGTGRGRADSRREKSKRPRSASPGKDDDQDDIDAEDIDDDDGDGDDRGKGRPRGRRPYKQRKSMPPDDERAKKKFGRNRKCQACTTTRQPCSGGPPCDRCVRTGKTCEPEHGEGLPYNAAGPPPNNQHDGGAPAASSSRGRRGSGRPRGRPRRNPAPPVDPLERTWAQFEGLYNPFNFRGPAMEDVPTAEVPTTDRMNPLPVPAPPLWHAARNERFRDVQMDAQRDMDRDVRRRVLEAQRMEAAALGDLGPGMGFGGTAELAHRPRWDEQAARETWFVNESSTAVPIIYRPEPEPYDINRPSNPMPDFGRNMVEIGLSVNSQIPPPPHGEQIPWIATWNYEGQGTTETRGPLGWPYPTIDALDHGHRHNAPGIFDPVDCCENANQFTEVLAPNVRCNENPAMMCEVWPEYDRDHQRNPWHTCNTCRHAQWDFYAQKQQEILLRQKLYVCTNCGVKIRREGRSWPKECLCYATKTCRDLCHLHREQIENAAEGPILIAEDYLIRSNILAREWDKCINCGVEDASPYSDVWSCKLCREWVQDSGRSYQDRKRRK